MSLSKVFNSYSSIENSYKDKFINQILTKGFHTQEWVKTEKIHGCNFSAIITGQSEIQWCRRNDILKPGENFNNYKKISQRYTEDLKDIFFALKTQHKNLCSIQVYGELFGGIYNHPNVSSVPGVSAVMKGINYNPDIDWIIYDILLTNLEGDKIKSSYLDYKNLTQLVDRYAKTLRYLPPEYGTFEELMSHPEVFPTTIPTFYGLPEIKDNMAEGFVIKPVVSQSFPTGVRVIVKKKNPKFLEVKKMPKSQPKTSQTEVDSFMKQIIPYLTIPRIQSVVSKMTEAERKQLQKVSGLLIKDALKEAELQVPLKIKKEVNFAMNKYVIPMIVNVLKEQ